MKFIFIIFCVFNGTISINGQSVKIGSIRINGTISYSIKLEELKKSSVQIDSIIAIPESMEMSTADSLIYIGRTYFEYYKESGMCVLNVLIFNKKIETITVGNIQLTGSTTIREIQSFFSENCSTTNPISIYGDSKTYQTCEIPVVNSDGEILDIKLLFFFSEGILKRMDFWETG